ncbi:hypothetical protein B9Z65_3314 [Elsinoe australis]|uniref:Uncharacterized protein n=1 Tax=Elsinoe australis TaxID=40998 RepID=A0A2P7ZY10_9PEZI|nr:hypothetical protein B9Z65_3314 [Elsinoe australis]
MAYPTAKTPQHSPELLDGAEYLKILRNREVANFEQHQNICTTRSEGLPAQIFRIPVSPEEPASTTFLLMCDPEEDSALLECPPGTLYLLEFPDLPKHKDWIAEILEEPTDTADNFIFMLIGAIAAKDQPISALIPEEFQECPSLIDFRTSTELQDRFPLGPYFNIEVKDLLNTSSTQSVYNSLGRLQRRFGQDRQGRPLQALGETEMLMVGADHTLFGKVNLLSGISKVTAKRMCEPHRCEPAVKQCLLEMLSAPKGIALVAGHVFLPAPPDASPRTPLPPSWREAEEYRVRTQQSRLSDVVHRLATLFKEQTLDMTSMTPSTPSDLRSLPASSANTTSFPLSKPQRAHCLLVILLPTNKEIHALLPRLHSSSLLALHPSTPSTDKEVLLTTAHLSAARSTTRPLVPIPDLPRYAAVWHDFFLETECFGSLHRMREGGDVRVRIEDAGHSLAFAMMVVAGLELPPRIEEVYGEEHLLKQRLAGCTDHWARFRELYAAMGKKGVDEQTVKEFDEEYGRLREFTLRFADVVVLHAAEAVRAETCRALRPELVIVAGAERVPAVHSVGIWANLRSVRGVVFVGEWMLAERRGYKVDTWRKGPPSEFQRLVDAGWPTVLVDGSKMEGRMRWSREELGQGGEEVWKKLVKGSGGGYEEAVTSDDSD